MASFEVYGPFEIPTIKNKVSRSIGSDEIDRFWQVHTKFGSARGCYIFGFRAAKGWKPFYIGKAAKSYRQEVFTHHKLNKIMHALSNQRKGTLGIFLVSAVQGKGRVNEAAIDQVETFLIQTGLAANKFLQNERKTKQQSWSINGVFKSRRGKPSAAASDFKKYMKIDL
jgi:hypothetical protein